MRWETLDMGMLKMFFRSRRWTSWTCGWSSNRKGLTGASALLAMLLAAGGCENGPTYSHRRLVDHQAMLDFAGLEPVETFDGVKACIQVPQRWVALDPQRTLLYTNQQWRSPSRSTGVGIMHIRLPIPLPLRTLMWMARQEYAKKASDGRVLGEWTDRIGRQWIEAENNLYHVRGYVVLDNRDAWFIYSGYKTADELKGAELALAARSVETAVPLTPVAKRNMESIAAGE